MLKLPKGIKKIRKFTGKLSKNSDGQIFKRQ